MQHNIMLCKINTNTSSHAQSVVPGAFSSNFSSTTIELNLKNDRQIYLSRRQSANRVKYLPVTFFLDLVRS